MSVNLRSQEYFIEKQYSKVIQPGVYEQIKQVKERRPN